MHGILRFTFLIKKKRRETIHRNISIETSKLNKTYVEKRGSFQFKMQWKKKRRRETIHRNISIETSKFKQNLLVGKEIPFNLRCKKNKNKRIGSFLIFRSRLVERLSSFQKASNQHTPRAWERRTKKSLIRCLWVTVPSRTGCYVPEHRGEGIAFVGGGGTATIEEVERGLETERNIPRDSTD